MALLGDRESRLFIDGKLVAGSGGTFPTVNPATEETLGVAADATVDDMDARDRRGPSRLRRHRLGDQRRVARALHPAAAAGLARSRGRTARTRHRRGGRSSDADVDGAVRRPGRGSELLCRHRRELPVDHRPRRRGTDGHQDPPDHRQGGHRRRRCDHAVELPEPDQPRQARTGAGGGQHRRAQAGARHPVERGGARPADPRAHRHPGGRRQHRHVQ